MIYTNLSLTSGGGVDRGFRSGVTFLVVSFDLKESAWLGVGGAVWNGKVR